MGGEGLPSEEQENLERVKNTHEHSGTRESREREKHTYTHGTRDSREGKKH